MLLFLVLYQYPPQYPTVPLNGSDELWKKIYGRSFLIRVCDSNVTSLLPFVQNYTCTVVLEDGRDG